MARKDDILNNFLSHPLIEKYEVQKPIPRTVREALNSQDTIVKAIALIVDNLESSNSITDQQIYKSITQYLSSAAI